MAKISESTVIPLSLAAALLSACWMFSGVGSTVEAKVAQHTEQLSAQQKEITLIKEKQEKQDLDVVQRLTRIETIVREKRGH